MSYFFVECAYGTKDSGNFNPDRPLFRELNSNKFGRHSANLICRDDLKKEVAVRCNCGKNTYHKIIVNKTKIEVDWSKSLSKKELNTHTVDEELN